MAQLTILGVLFGSILGTRWNVLSLVLAIGVTGGGIAFDGVARHIGVWALADEIALVTVSLQVGYLAGSACALLDVSTLGRIFRRDRSRAC